MKIEGYSVRYLPVNEIIVNIEVKNGQVWVETETGKKYIVPMDPKQEIIRADIRLVDRPGQS